MSWATVAIVTLAPMPLGMQPVAVLAAAPDTLSPKVRRLRDEAEQVELLATALRACPNPLPYEERWRLARIIRTESIEHGWDPLFIAALVQVESGCSATARGGEAIGLTQMLPATARGVARRAGLPWRGPSTLTEPKSSVQLGIRYLHELEDMFDDPYKAVAAYNLGPAPVMRMSSARAAHTRYVRRVISQYERLLNQDA